MTNRVEISPECKGKRLVMTPEMFVHEMSAALLAMIEVMFIEPTAITKGTAEIFCREYSIRHMNSIWERNKNAKPDDPEEIQ